MREALEETARIFVPERLIGIYLARFARPASGEDVTYLRFAFAGSRRRSRPGARRSTPASSRTLWLTLDELRSCRERHRSPLVLRGIEDDLAGRSLPLDAIVTDESVTGASRLLR